MIVREDSFGAPSMLALKIKTNETAAMLNVFRDKTTKRIIIGFRVEVSIAFS